MAGNSVEEKKMNQLADSEPTTGERIEVERNWMPDSTIVGLIIGGTLAILFLKFC